MKHQTYQTHPAADIFPMLDDDELAVLAHDIKANGLRQPIVLDTEGRVLDGRNRLKACIKAHVEPVFTNYDGTDPELFILSANIHRRHMTQGQRAMVTALILDAAGKRRNGRWARGSVPSVTSGSGSNGWPQRMAEAEGLLDIVGADDNLVRDVATGRVTLDQAISRFRPRAATKTIGAQITPPEPVVTRPDLHVVQSEESAPAAGEELQDELDDELDDADDAVAADDASAAGGSAPANRRGDDRNPVQRKEQGAARDAAEEQKLEAIWPVSNRIWGLDDALHQIGLADLTGKARQDLLDDLERIAKTIEWAVSKLRHEAGD